MERTSEEWGRVAVGLPGWRWMPGMLAQSLTMRVVAPQVATCTGFYRGRVDPPDSGSADGWCRAWSCNVDEGIDDALSGSVPDLDDAATAGALLSLLGDFVDEIHHDSRGWSLNHHAERYPTLGRMCIASAEAFGRWPGGAA